MLCLASRNACRCHRRWDIVRKLFVCIFQSLSIELCEAIFDIIAVSLPIAIRSIFKSTTNLCDIVIFILVCILECVSVCMLDVSVFHSFHSTSWKNPKHVIIREKNNPWPSKSYFVLLALNRNTITLIKTKISLVALNKIYFWYYTALLPSHLPFCVHAKKIKHQTLDGKIDSQPATETSTTEFRRRIHCRDNNTVNAWMCVRVCVCVKQIGWIELLVSNQ